MNGGRKPGRPNLNWFTNRSGKRRLSISMSLQHAYAIAVGDEDTLALFEALILNAVETEERPEE